MAKLACSSPVPLIIYPSVFLILVFLLFASFNHQFDISHTVPSPPSSASSPVSGHRQSKDQLTSSSSSPSSSSSSSSSNALKDFVNNFTSRSRVKVEKSSLERIEEGLARARKAIREAAQSKSYGRNKYNFSSSRRREMEFVPKGPVYRNPYALYQLSLCSSVLLR
ncbi:hypothetical protein CDL15_Pgr004541 [Punica granatum]|uniref:Uncharacterized protein n=1 Tax=Punica granatum TaxID=22663 RepID=A0A218WPK9_PUNGR|nr:hypothetical protein CDL15_Pgr004541 [Punica granatum]